MNSEILTARLEDYIEAIYHLVNRHGVARTKQIAERLEVNMSTVTGALRNLSASGMVHYEPYQYVRLTDKGKEQAERVVRRHNVLRRLLENVLNIESGLAEENACRMEHAIDKHVLDRLVKFVNYIESSPERLKEWSVSCEGMKNVPRKAGHRS